MKLGDLWKTVRKAVTRRRGLGYRPNPTDERDRQYKKASQRPKAKKSLRKYVEIVDQSYTSSCVACAVAGALRVMEKKSGHDYGFPSALFLYWNARRRYDKPPLKDDGTYIRECFKALTKLGVPDEENWPFKPSRVNDKPRGYSPWAKADPRKGGEYLAITGTKSKRVDRIKAAIDDGYPVVFGTDIAKSFMKRSSFDVIDRPDRNDKIIGGHAMLIVDYRTVDGDTQFLVANSWGRKWRDGGFCWFTERYIRWSQTGDFTIVHGWERIAS
jgi:C1A family cysteine protease